MRALHAIGRALFGGYFVWNGINHFQNREMLAGYAGSKGTPAPELAVPISGALILAGGSLVAGGIKPRLGLWMIVGFLIPVSLQMHGFWTVDDQNQRLPEMINFTKNMALVGAALTMMGMHDPWPVSVDAVRLPEGRTMHAPLTPRELRSLPA